MWYQTEFDFIVQPWWTASLSIWLSWLKDFPCTTSVTKSFKNSTAAPASEKHPRNFFFFAINFVRQFALQFQSVTNQNERSNLRTQSQSKLRGRLEICQDKNRHVAWWLLFYKRYLSSFLYSGDLYPLSFSYGSLWFTMMKKKLNERCPEGFSAQFSPALSVTWWSFCRRCWFYRLSFPW